MAPGSHALIPAADTEALPMPTVRAVVPHSRQPAQAWPQPPRHCPEGLYLRVSPREVRGATVHLRPEGPWGTWVWGAGGCGWGLG